MGTKHIVIMLIQQNFKGKSIKYCVISSILLLPLTACKNTSSNEQNVVTENFDCKKGEMTPAWYEHGVDEPIPNIKRLRNGFLILVDTNNKSTNFVSFSEDYARKRSTEVDTSDFAWNDGWENMTTKQKLERAKQERKSFQTRADAIHQLNNEGQQQVWIINNTKDTVTIQMQDWSYVCVLQAKTRTGQWCPIQYWRFSFCGNSYYLKHFPPNTANSFVTKLPDSGDYVTKLRYKLLGADKFYYSNEFDGRINYCEFVEDSTVYNNLREERAPHFKLDSVVKLTWR